MLDTPKCIRDELCEWFLSTFPTPDELSTARARIMASSIMLLMDIDVLDVEAKHSSSRRLVNIRSIQTWPLQFSQLAAEFTTWQHVTSMQRVVEQSSSTQSLRHVRKQSKTRGRALMRGRGGFGGAWRVYVSESGRGRGRGRGGGRHRIDFGRRSMEYWRIQRAGGPEWLRLQRAGRVATERGRRQLQLRQEQQLPEPAARSGSGA